MREWPPPSCKQGPRTPLIGLQLPELPMYFRPFIWRPLAPFITISSGPILQPRWFWYMLGPRRWRYPPRSEPNQGAKNGCKVLGPLCAEMYTWNISRFVLFKILGALGTYIFAISWSFHQETGKAGIPSHLMEHLVVLSASPLYPWSLQPVSPFFSSKGRASTLDFVASLKCEKLFSPEDPEEYIPKIFQFATEKWWLKGPHFLFGANNLFFAEADFLFNFRCLVFFFATDVCLGVKKNPRILCFFFDRKALTFCIFWVHPPTRVGAMEAAMMACWVVKLGSFHHLPASAAAALDGRLDIDRISQNGGKSKRWIFVQEFLGKPKKEPSFVVSDGTIQDIAGGWKAGKKNRQIEVEVVFKKGQPSLISFGNDAIVNPMRSSLRNASDEEFWTLRHRGKSG